MGKKVKEEFDFSDVVETPDDFDFSDVVEPKKETPVKPEPKSSFWDKIRNTVTDAIGVTASSATPEAAPFIDPLAKSVGNELFNRIPETIAQLKIKGKSARAKEIESMLAKNPEFANNTGIFGSKTLAQDLQETKSELPELSNYVDSKKKDSQLVLKDNVQNLTDIKSASDFANWLATSVGQAGAQIPLSVLTGGASSFLMESAAVYDEQLDLLSKKYGISREEVINQGLDKPAEGEAFAALAGALDFVSAGKILKLFKRAGTKQLKTSTLKQLLTNSTTEALTEGVQGQLESAGAASGADTEFKFDLNKFINEASAGAVGGGAVGSFSRKIQETEDKVNRTLNEVADTGDNQINAQIDADATLSPDEEKQLLTKIQENEKDEKGQQKKVLTDTQSENVEPINQPTDEKINEEVRDVQDGQGQESEGGQQSRQEDGQEGNVEEKITFDQTPEYKAADQKVREASLNFIKEDSPENLSLLLEARQERDNARIEFEKKPSKKEKQEPIVINNPAKALKEQIQQHYKTLAEGVKKGQEGKNELITKVQEVLDKSKLTTTQTKSILNKIKNTNLFTAGSVSKLIDFTTKVAENAEYAEKLNEASSLRKSVVGKFKSPLRSFREKQLGKIFSKIKPSEVENIDEYLSLANEIKEGQKLFKVVNLESTKNQTRNLLSKIYQQELNVAPPETATVEDLIDDIENKRYENRRLEMVQKIADELNITPQEAELVIDDSETSTSKDKKEQARQALLSVAKDKKIEPSEDFNKIQNADVDAIKNIDPSLLTAKQLRDYITIVDRINENGDFGLSGILASISKAQQGWKEMLAKDTKTLNLTQLEQLMDSQPMAIEAIFGLPKDAALFQLYSGIKGMSDSNSVAIQSAEALADKLNELHKKNPKGFTDESLFRQGLYQELIRYPESMNPDEALAINKQLIESDIKKLEGRPSMKKYRNRLIEFYKPFKDATTIDQVKEIMSKIDKDGKAVLDLMVDFHDNHKVGDTGMNLLELLQSDSERFENKDTEKTINYASPRARKKIGSREVEMDGIDEFSYNTKLPKPKQIKSSKSLTMTDREGSILDLNIHKNAIDNIQKSVLQASAKPYRYQLREFANNKENLLKLFGGGEKADNLIDSLFNPTTGIVSNFEIVLMNNKLNDTSKLVKSAKQVLGALRKIGYNLTLGGITQAPKQATVVTNVMRQTGDGSVISSISEIAQDKQGANNFFAGETISTRSEQQAIINLGRFYNASERLDVNTRYNRFFDSISRYADKRFKNKFTGAGVLTSTDVNVAKASWLTFYKEYLKQKGETFLGFEKETSLKNDKIRQEARAYAKQRVDTLQVVSNPAEQAALLKDPSFSAEVLKSFFLPYGTFNASSKARLFNDYKALITGNSAQRENAWKDIQATFIEQSAFTAVGIGVRLGFYGGIGYLLQQALKMDDDDETWEEWWAKTKKTIAKDMIFSNLPVILTSPGEDFMVDFLNNRYYDFLKAEDPSLTQKEYEKDHAPLIRYKNFDKDWYDYLGPAGAIFAKMADGIGTIKDVNDEDKKLSDEQRRLGGISALFIVGNMLGLAPSDIVNATKSEFNKQKRMTKETKSVKTFQRPQRPTLQRPQRPNLERPKR